MKARRKPIAPTNRARDSVAVAKRFMSANAAPGSSVQQQDLDVPGGPFDIQPHRARNALHYQIGGSIADLPVSDRQAVQTLGQVRVLDDDPVEAGVDPDTH